MPQEQIEKVYQLLGYFDTAVLVTHGVEGHHHARPMALARVDPNCDIWFFISRTSVGAREIERDPEALLVLQDEHSRYLSLSGSASLVTDREIMRALWDEKYATWFPNGVEDPDLALIWIRTVICEYWDHVGARGIKYMFEAAKAYARGAEKPELEEAEHHARVVLK